MIITHEAVEAAANAISEASGMRFDGFWMRMDELEPEDRDYALAEARAALEAATPFLAAALSAAGFGPVQEAQREAWAAGYDKGTDLCAWAISNRTDMERPDTTNPYRTEASS